MEEKSENKFSVWISWCHDEGVRKHVEALEKELRSNAAVEIEVSSSLRLKDPSFRGEINKCIKKSSAYVLLVTKRFPESSEIDKELDQIRIYGAEEDREIFPLLVESCELPKADGGQKGNLQKILQDLEKQLDSLGNARSPQYNNVRAPLTYESMALKILDHFGIMRKEKGDGPLFEYEDAISKGAFVPYIGPDCYGLRDEWEPYLETLGARLDNISKRFRVVSSKDTLEADLEYLKAVVMSHNPDLCVRGELHGGPVAGEDASGNLFELRVAVARAGAAASRLLGKSLSRCKGLIDAKAYRVIITEMNDPDVLLLREELESAQQYAKGCAPQDFCSGYGGSSKGCMGSHHIAAKLELFLRAVFKSQEEGGHAVEVRLSLSKLDWLGDLLWHMMRFDLAIFPKPEEIDFCLALCQKTKVFTRIPFGTTAAIWTAEGNGTDANPGERPLTVAQCSEFMHVKLCDLKGTGSTKFYRAISKLLWNSYSLYQKKQASTGDGGYDPAPYRQAGKTAGAGGVAAAPSGTAAAENGKVLYPIAVSMNFDEEIENCLSKAMYSVLFPVRVKNQRATQWLLRVHEKGKDTYYAFPMETLSDTDVNKYLRGPLIVKYRGSPLHQVRVRKIERIGPAMNSELRTSAENRLLLSSLDFMQELSTANLGEPQWLKQQLDDPSRVKCFLGYPLDDIDGILGIQRNVWVEEPQEVEEERVSIGCKHRDGLDHELLTGLRVKPLSLDLNDFAAEVNKFREYEDIESEG